MRDFMQKRRLLAPAVAFQKTFSGEDRTPFELFVAGVRSWEADLRRYFPGKSEG
jgi:hypothetical protein